METSNQSLPQTTCTLIGRANVANVGVSNGVRFMVVASVGGHILWEQVRWQPLLGLKGLIHHSSHLQVHNQPTCLFSS